MATRCYVCQKNPAIEGLIYCQECDDRVKNPPHVHEWKAFKFSEDSNVTYYDCTCGERRMTAVDAV